MRALRQPYSEQGEGHVIAEIFSGPDYSEFKDVFYYWEKIPEGIIVYCKPPQLLSHTPDDIKLDITMAIEQDLGERIYSIEWQ